MNPSSLRVPLLLVAAVVACVLIPGLASGADPKAGNYAGEEGDFELDFKVQDPASKPSKVKGFEFSGPFCTSDPDAVNTIEVPKPMKVKSSGKFTFDGEGEGTADGGGEIESSLSVNGKFSASKTAKGTLFIGACPLAGLYEFVIKKGGGDSLENVPQI